MWEEDGSWESYWIPGVPEHTGSAFSMGHLPQVRLEEALVGKGGGGKDGWHEGDPWAELPAVVCHSTTQILQVLHGGGGEFYTLHTLDIVVTL